MNEELEPCRHCGGNVELLNYRGRLNRDYVGWFVYCSDCDLYFGFDVDYGGVYPTKEAAIEEWNRRVEDET